MVKLTIPVSLFSPQSWHIMMSKSTNLRSKCVHTATLLLRHPVKYVVLSSPLICSSLFHPRIHLSSHIKRVKSLLREDCVQRYKELLASTRIWSRSVQALKLPFSWKYTADLLTRSKSKNEGVHFVQQKLSHKKKFHVTYLNQHGSLLSLLKCCLPAQNVTITSLKRNSLTLQS